MNEKLRILVIDDEPNVTSTIKRGLARKGFDVIELNDPLKIEEYLLYTDLSLVITDLKMPGMDGLRVLELVKQCKTDLPVLILTGHGTIQTAVEATRLGAADFLTKPFNNQDLLSVVQRHAKVDQALPDDIKESFESQEFKSQETIVVKPDKVLLPGEIISTETIPNGFKEVKFENIITGQFLPFALYIQIYNQSSQRYFLRKISNENTVLTTGLWTILQKRGLGSVYIREQNYSDYLEYFNAVKSAPGVLQKHIQEKKKLDLYDKAVESIREILAEPLKNKNVKHAVGLVSDIFKSIDKDPCAYHDMFKMFTRDAKLFNHSSNVCLLSMAFGLYLGIEPKKVQVLGLGALFHDVGMNTVDNRILEKRTALTRAEWQHIKGHPERGYSMVKSSGMARIPVLKIIFQHHEKNDGTGYPMGLVGDQIDFFALLFRIVDMFDTMTTKKPYRDAFTAAQALKQIYLTEPSARTREFIREFIRFLGGQKE